MSFALESTLGADFAVLCTQVSDTLRRTHCVVDAETVPSTGNTKVR